MLLLPNTPSVNDFRTCVQGGSAEVVHAAGAIGDIPQDEHMLRAAMAAQQAALASFGMRRRLYHAMCARQNL